MTAQTQRTAAWILFCVVFVHLSLVSCIKPKGEGQVPVIKIGHAPHDHHSPLYVAALNQQYFSEDLGIYLKEKVFKKEYELIADGKTRARVLIDSSTGGKRIIRRLVERQIDLCLGGVPAMLYFMDKGDAIRILAPVMSEGAGLVVNKKLAIDSWDSFVNHVKQAERPVKIGYKIAISVQNIIFEEALRQEGIGYSRNYNDSGSKVNLVNLYGAKNLIPALQNGLIDGFVVNQPVIAKAVEQKIGKIVAFLQELPPEGKWQGTPCCALAGSTAFVERYSEEVELLIALLVRSNIFIKENPEQSVDMISYWLGMNPKIERLSLPTIKFVTNFDENWDQGVSHWIDSMIASNRLTGRVKTAREAATLENLIYDREIYSRAQARIK